MSTPRPAALRCLLLAWLAGGCHLIDQRDFDSAAGQPPAPPSIPVLPPAASPTLVTIGYATPDPQYREALTGAAQRALARKSDVLFTVTTLVPGQPSPDAQATEAQRAAVSGREVAQVIVDAGAAPGQVEQVVRVQPGLSVRTVQVAVH